MTMHGRDNGSLGSARGLIFKVVAALVLIGLVFFVPILWMSTTKTDGGQYDVVRNGGPFDSSTIRQVIQPNSGLTWKGFFSVDHRYPSSERNFKVSPEGKGDSDESINVSTKDGVHVGVEGTFYFNLTSEPGALRSFDDKFGTRTFPWGQESKYPWDGNEGWRAMLDFTLSNLMQTIFREEIGKVRCQDLQPSCALAVDPNAEVVETDPEALNKFVRNVNVRFSRLASDAFGGDFFVNPRFNLGNVTLPGDVVSSIDKAIAKRADLSTSLAAKQQAIVDAQTNREKQKGYNNCPSCAQIDILKALPPGITTFAPGQGFAVTGR